MAEFVHLNAHSEFSIGNGMMTPAELAGAAHRLGAAAVAQTDLANMFGAMRFERACLEMSVAPILGCEVRVKLRGASNSSAPVVLLASGSDGYGNLLKLIGAQKYAAGSASVSLSLEQLAANRAGLVMLTGGQDGYVAQTYLTEGIEAARDAAALLAACFAPGHAYVELQDHRLPQQARLNGVLCDVASHVGLELVATNGCRYAERCDARGHHVLSMVGLKGELLRSPTPLDSERYLKSAAEMSELFAHQPAAIRNTLRIAEMTAGTASTFAPLASLPCTLPAGAGADAHLENLANTGLATQLATQRSRGFCPDYASYDERLSAELAVIRSKGLSSYFLIVHDFVSWARQNGAQVGPGRGSGAGSLVAYALGITEIDPLPYGLSFERFLNVERSALPDLDIDVCGDLRDAVIDYLRLKYGVAHVALVSKFDFWRGRSALAETARMMDLQSAKLAQVEKLLPRREDSDALSLASILQEQPSLVEFARRDADVGALVAGAGLLDGRLRRVSRHPSGVVISKAQIDHIVPVGEDDGMPSSQFDKDDLEGAGLIKFDVLSSPALNLYSMAAKLVGQSRRGGEAFKLENIPLDDAATYRLLSDRPSSLIFQLSGDGMRQLMQQAKPVCLEDIANVIGLYRPGPLDERATFVARRHGSESIEYPHPILADALRPTYGVILYQEQVMRCAQLMAGYGAAASDVLVRAISKKKPDVLARQWQTFLAGARERGHSEQDAERVFGLLSRFAGYGFNKSHGIAYATLTYRCAFLLANYPAEFLCAALSVGDRDEQKAALEQAALLGIEVLPVDIDQSHSGTAVVYATTNPESSAEHRPRVRLGLTSVHRLLGHEVAAAIVDARGSAGFGSLADFVERVPLKSRAPSIVLALVEHGAFDGIIAKEGVDRQSAAAKLAQAARRRALRKH